MINIDNIVERVLEEFKRPCVKIEASGRHIHLNVEAVETLFGKGYKLTKVSELSQPGQYVCKERISIEGPKGILNNIVILGPERKSVQVEVSKTDAVILGLKVPVRQSGNLKGTPGVTLIGPKGRLCIKEGTIVAERHIHMSQNMADLYKFNDGQRVNVSVDGERSLVYRDVVLRVSSEFNTYMHIDYDEANACGFSKNMIGRIEIPK